jgi:hypothetical protein
MIDDDVRSINSVDAGEHKLGAWMNVNERNANALEDVEYGKKFKSRKHKQLIQDALDIIEKFFPNCKGIYINHRLNKGDPFTAIKVDHPQWSMDMQKRKHKDYIDPLLTIGVKIINTKQGTVHRIKV